MEQDLENWVPTDAELYAEREATGQADGSVALDVVKGLAAGVVATGAMVATRNWMYAHEDDEARAREARVREDAQVTPLQVPTRKAADAMGRPLTKEQERRIANGLAWGLGIASAAGYAVARKRMRGVGAGRGLAFGTALWAIEDELMMPLLGFTPGPRAYPWQAHSRGLVSHAVHAVVADATLDALDRVT